MGEDVKALIDSAAPQTDAATLQQSAPESTPVDTGATAGMATTGDEDAAFMQELCTLLRSNPELANQVADVIEEFFGRGGEKSKQATATPTAQVSAEPNATAFPPQLLALAQALDRRLSRLEKSQADMALEKELAETKQEYEKLKEHFPILPDLSNNEILQIALQYEGLPLKEALNLWAMRKLQEGEGTVADRLVAAKIEQSKGNRAPRVESKGGELLTGEQEPPATFREARRRAKETLAAIFGGPIG